MYDVCGSFLFLNYVSEAASAQTSYNPNIEKSEKNVNINNRNETLKDEDEESDPDDELEDEDPGEEEPSEKEKFNAIQKFILYNKLRELQYKLDDVEYVSKFKDRESIVKLSKFLSYIIMFFSILNYKEAFKITERVIDEFKKIK